MDENDNQETPPGLALRVTVSIIVLFGLLIFAVVYIAFFSSFSLIQNIAIVLVALLVAIAILGVMWAYWGINLGKEWKDKGCK